MCTPIKKRLANYIEIDIMPKRIVWLGNSLEMVRQFPSEAKQRAGRQLNRVQEGREPDDWKPMPTIGLGVNEIRVRAGGAYRVLYVAKFQEAIYVVHAFEKKTQKTAAVDLDLARKRFRQLVNERKAN